MNTTDAGEQRIHHLLDQALSLEVKERRRFLDNACGGNSALFEDLWAALAFDADPGEFMERPVMVMADVLAQEAGRQTPEMPERIGPYRLLDVLGEGGMGRVYLAEQTEPVRRRVAVKVVRSALADPAAVARFAAERQALAGLDHPRICRILDAGTTDDGFLFFAMDLVDGEPITAYCDRTERSVEERLEIFIDICHGVQHAHHKQLLHRDLKPSNILVVEEEGRPMPKIIDFGIAKSLDLPLTEATLTRGDLVIGTPAYMSPEALDGSGDLDTRSDVYALGILLYELLTGSRPFEAKDSGILGVARQVIDEEPQRPSARVRALDRTTSTRIAGRRNLEVAELRQRLRRDLDWIVLKAIAKDREQRYSSVSELAADLERCLRDDPVLARPPSFRYVAVKFVHRHRLAVALALLTVCGLAAAAVFSSLALSRALEAEEQTRREADGTREVLSFVVNLFEAASPEDARGEEVSAREILDRGADRIRQGDLKPLQRARILHTLADVYARLGLYEPGRDLASEALTVHEEELAFNHPDLLASIELLGNLERRSGRLDDAAILIERLVAVLESDSGTEPLALADALNSLGNLRWRQKQYGEAERLHRQALELREAELGPEAAEVAASHNNLGALFLTQMNFGEAETHLRKASGLLERIHGPDHPRVADILGNRALVLFRLGRHEESEAMHRRVLRIREKVLGPEHPDTAATLNNLAILYAQTDRLAEAETYHLKTLEVRRKALGEEHIETVKTLSNLGLVYWRAKRYDDAERFHREALAISTRAFTPDPQRIARSQVNLAMVLRDTDRFKAAKQLLDMALLSQRETLGSTHRDVALTLLHLGILSSRQGQLGNAEAQLRESVAIREATSSPEPKFLAESLHELGAVYMLSDRNSEARELFVRALEIRREVLPAGHPDIRLTEAALASLADRFASGLVQP